MEKVTIKLLDSPDNPKLKMKYIGSVEYATPKIAPDGKIRTGVDENAFSILSMSDPAAQKKKAAAVKAERLELERLLGVELGPHSSFWDKFFIPLTDEEIPLDPGNPLDRLKERYLVANNYVAPSIDAIYEDEEYVNCIFYIHRDEVETTKKVEFQKTIDKAKGKLWAINEENPNKLKILASYIFGYNIDADITPDKAYQKLTEFIEEKDAKLQKTNVQKFLDAVDMKQELMTTKLILDKAIRKKVVTVRKEVHYYNGEPIGNNYEAALETISSVSGNSLLSSIMQKVNQN